MKAILIQILVCCLLWAQSQGQYFNSPNETNCSHLLLEESVGTETMSLPFSSVVVNDLRPDSSKLGYSTTLVFDLSKKLCLKNGTAKGLTTFLHHYLSQNFSDSQAVLIINIKKLWITVAETENAETVNINEPSIIIDLNAEFFLRKNSLLYPLYRFDSTFAMLKKDVRTNLFLQHVIESSASKLFQLRLYNLARRKGYTQAAIDSINMKQHHLRIESTLRKGVYLTFHDFINNTPLTNDYKVEMRNLTDDIYIKDSNGNFGLSQSVWGYCDGKDLFIKAGQNLFKLFAVQDTWEFWGSTKYEHKRAPLNNNTDKPSKTWEKTGKLKLARRIPYQVDMQTGGYY